MNTAALVEALRCACRFDVLAEKPGNVSLAAPGHGMEASQFLSSAAAAAPALTCSALQLGEAIERAVRASVAVAGCNTNLGIVLLAAPLLRAAMMRTAGVSLERQLADELRRTSVSDAACVFAAITHARPGGLGRSAEQDVSGAPDRPLTDVMRLAAVRDRIAYQYAHDFVDIFQYALPLLREYRGRGVEFRWAVSGVYLGLLAEIPDSHIVRKFDTDTAERVRSAARTLERVFKACENPASLAPRMKAFDRELKRGGVNPGTSADLTVASVLTLLLQHA